MTNKVDRSAFVNSIVKGVTDKFGKGIAHKLNDVIHASGTKCISTGNLNIDYAIGGRTGGIPTGMITEISGWESSGKTLLAMSSIAEAQKSGGVGVYFDSECVFSPSLAQKLGVDVNALSYFQPNTVEQVFELMKYTISFVRENYIDNHFILVWDSLAATPIQSEIDGKVTMGEKARILSKELSSINKMISTMNVSLIIINQLRTKIGVMYGSPDVTPGGTALPFYASVRLRTKKGDKILDAAERCVGEWFKVSVIKNKIAPPFRIADFEIYFDKGIPKYSGLYYTFKNCGIIKTSGGWNRFTFDEESKFRTAEFNSILESHPEFLDKAFDLMEDPKLVSSKEESKEDF